jgi:hypothetical protein
MPLDVRNGGVDHLGLPRLDGPVALAQHGTGVAFTAIDEGAARQMSSSP